MKKLLFFCLLIILVFVFSNCNSENKNASSFKLEIFDTLDNQIKEFKVANIMPYFKDGKWGYANLKGEIVIPCQYQKCGFFSDGMAWMKKDIKFGYIDTTGHIAIKAEYEDAQDFYNGKAIVQKTGYKGIIDKKNNVIVPFKFESLVINEDGFIHARQNQQWGLLKPDGSQLMNPIYDENFEFRDDLADVSRKGLYGVINRNGQEIVVCKYNRIIQVRNKLFIASIKKSYKEIYYGLIDPSDNVKIPIIYKDVKEAAKNVFILENENGKGLFTSKGDTITGFIYKDMKAGNTNILAACNTNGKWGFIDLGGKIVIPFQFASAEPFINNHAIVANYYFGVINSSNEFIIPLEHEHIDMADKQIFKVYNKSKYGFYSIDGKKLTETVYDDSDYNHDYYYYQPGYGYSIDTVFGKFVNNYAIIGMIGRMGAINKNGQVIIQPYYHSMSGFDSRGIAIVSYQGAYGLVDKTGKTIAPVIYPEIKQDNISGYYYIEMKDGAGGENNKKEINCGYFGLDGKLYSSLSFANSKQENEEDIILKIRKEYQNIISSVKTAGKTKSVSIGDSLQATWNDEGRLIISNARANLNFEYYYNNKLNPDGPFFILRSDKSSSETKYDRYYFEHGQIVRWVDQSGKQQLVANAPYAPEHDEHFNARLYKKLYENQLVLNSNNRGKEIEKIDNLVKEIDQAIADGKYKKGDVHDNQYETSAEGSEDYTDSKGNMIFHKDYSGSDHYESTTKDYYKNGKLIYSIKTSYESEFMRGNDQYGDYISEEETYTFSDGKTRKYSTHSCHAGQILEITED